MTEDRGGYDTSYEDGLGDPMPIQQPDVVPGTEPEFTDPDYGKGMVQIVRERQQTISELVNNVATHQELIAALAEGGSVAIAMAITHAIDHGLVTEGQARQILRRLSDANVR